ncbi:MAG: ABC transporter ATP-binding protein [Bacteroidetes bacterium]|nr:ABC transporter ATP-binding protein [Bacteroidota bacterium]
MIAELLNISKVYEKPGSGIQQRVLDDISLQITESDTLAIIGPSGSGKSTFLNILGTLDRPSSGTLLLQGQLINPDDSPSLAYIRNKCVGFVFQLHHLLPQLSLLENILLPTLPIKSLKEKQLAAERAVRLIERVGLQSHLLHNPSQLSVGECQRAAVVRALVNQPKLLLADEPTGSLDAENAEQLASLLLDLRKEQNFAIVAVTHSLELASKMDKVYKLSSGKLLTT